MIVKEYIRDFEKLGFGMFVHYGLYSVLGKGEWSHKILEIPSKQYQELTKKFYPKANWAEEIVHTAKKAGVKYITLTTRHHDGFSLYDTCGLSEYDSIHTCGRDLVREFVDECNKQGILPFFYHTLLDWYVECYENDFKSYLKYLRSSVELLCKNYGKIGGIWFDGMWDKKEVDWEEDALYGLIRAYQPEAMIINNTGLSALGALGHIELDSVTFERGRPKPINKEGAPKYIASEMCQVFGDHWGYASDDLNYKSPADMIRDLACCRRYGANLLMNVGPMEDGSLRSIDKAIFELMGQWMFYNEEAIHALPADIIVENREDDFLLKGGNTYYLFCHNLPMVADINVALVNEAEYIDIFPLDECVQSIEWLDTNEPVSFEQENGKVIVHTEPYRYGRNLVVRIAKITVN